MTHISAMTSSPVISLRWAQKASEVLLWIEGMSRSADSTPKLVVDPGDARTVTLCGMWGRDCTGPVDKLCELRLHAAVQARAAVSQSPEDESPDGVLLPAEGVAYGELHADGSIAFRLSKVDPPTWWTHLTDGADPRVRARCDWDHWTPPPDSEDMDGHDGYN